MTAPRDGAALARLARRTVPILLLGGAEPAWAQAPPAPEPKLPVEVRLDGYANADARISLTREGPRTFLLRRARVGVTGTAYRFVDFRYLMEFAAGEASSLATIQDAYLNVRFLPAAQLQVGQFKVPFPREWATSARWVDFIERPTSVDETRGDREMGAAFHGAVGGERLEYWLGAFNGTRINRVDNNHAKDLLVRLVAQPGEGVCVGGTLTRGDQEPQLGIRGRTPDRSVTFFPSGTVAGIRYRRGLEASYFHGPFSLSGEVLATSEEVAGSLEDYETRGWYAGGTFLLMGDVSPPGARCGRSRTSTQRPGPGARSSWQRATSASSSIPSTVRARGGPDGRDRPALAGALLVLEPERRPPGELRAHGLRESRLHRWCARGLRERGPHAAADLLLNATAAARISDLRPTRSHA